MCSCARSRWPARATTPRPATGSPPGATFADLDVDEAAGDAAERAVRAARRDAAADPAPAGHPRPARHPLAARHPRRGARRRGRAQGPVDVRRSRGRGGRRARVTLVDDPTPARRVRRGHPRRRGRPDPPDRADRRRAARRRSSTTSYTGRRSGAATTGSAVRGGFKSAPGVGARALHLEPGSLGARRRSWRRCPRRCTSSR